MATKIQSAINDCFTSTVSFSTITVRSIFQILSSSSSSSKSYCHFYMGSVYDGKSLHVARS